MATLMMTGRLFLPNHGSEERCLEFWTPCTKSSWRDSYLINVLLHALLTVLLVEQDLKLLRLVLVQRGVDLLDGGLVRELAVHEAHPAGLLHHLGPVVARRLAEGLVAVDDGVVNDLGVGQQEARVGCKKREEWGLFYFRCLREA